MDDPSATYCLSRTRVPDFKPHHASHDLCVTRWMQWLALVVCSLEEKKQAESKMAEDLKSRLAELESGGADRQQRANEINNMQVGLCWCWYFAGFRR